MIRHAVRWFEQSKMDLKEIFEHIKNIENREYTRYVIAGIKKAAIIFVFSLPFFSLSFGTTALSPDAAISILTSSPWDEEVYTLFGHTALRVQDKEQKIDLVFNYGVFDYHRPHFIWHFVRGETDYQLGVTTYANYVIEYEMNNLEVIEQVIRLTPEEKNCLWNKLLLNCLPENREYRYNFFFDNCSTRPFWLIESSINGKIELAPLDTVCTFRDLIGQCTVNFPWLTYSINLVVAQPADAQINKHQILFLPYHLMKALETAQIVQPDGNSYPLVESQSVIITPTPGYNTATGSIFALWRPSPLFVAILLLHFVFLPFIIGKKRAFLTEKKQQRTFAAIQAILFSVAGLAGCIVFFLCFFSEHPAMFPNWNLLWLHPLQLLVPIAVLIKSNNKLLYFYHIVNFALLSCFLVAIPFIMQTIPLASVFFAQALGFCSVRYIYCFKKYRE